MTDQTPDARPISEIKIQPTPSLTHGQMLKMIADSGISLDPMRSTALPTVGDKVIIGDSGNKEVLQIVTVVKIDRHGVIRASDGTRFTTDYPEIESINKIDDRYWSMYDLRQTYRQAVKSMRVSALRSKVEALRSQQHEEGTLR